MQRRSQRTKSGTLTYIRNRPQIWELEFLRLRDVCTVTASGFENSREDLELLHAILGEISRQIRPDE
jgi:hypothetical protein